MKILLVGILFTTSLFADTYVRGHYRKNGSYVKGHYRSTRDSSHNNNWSTRYNVNPYTGTVGKKKRKAESVYDTYKPRRKRKSKNIYGW